MRLCRGAHRDRQLGLSIAGRMPEIVGDPVDSQAPAFAAFLFWRLLTRSSTTAGSASVDVSPRLPYSSSAILRRILRMILPERVLGRLGANWIRSGEAIGPISFRTHCTSSLRRSSLAFSPAISVTYA